MRGPRALPCLFALTLALATTLVPEWSRDALARDAGAAIRARLARGRSAYAQQEYREAIRTLRPLVKDPAATRAQKVQALELLGLSMLIIDQTESARAAFEDLLALDPGYVLTDPSQSPKIRKFFEDVKRGYLPDFRPGERALLEHTAPTGAVAGRRLDIDARVVEGADRVVDLVLLWRKQGLIDFEEERLDFRKDGSARASLTLPGDRSAYVVEYYLEARGKGALVLARAGSPDAPLAVEVRGASGRERPWYRRWYIWAGAGAALAAGLTVGILAATAEDAPAGTLGTITCCE